METQSGAPALIYLYAFIPTEEYEKQEWDAIEGIEPPNEVEFIEYGEITAVTCRVPEAEYGEKKLQKQVENMQWLQGRAFHHHELMNVLHDRFTVLPLKFGTIYSQPEHLTNSMEEHRDRLASLFDYLHQKEEWNMKIFVDKSKFISAVVENSPEMEEKKLEIENLSPGRKFFEKKKIDQFVEDTADENIKNTCKAIHEKLSQKSFNTEVKKNWERKVTGREEEMSWNGVYLIDKAEREALLSDITKQESEAKENNTGLSFEITGPWPAYHFSEFLNRGEENGR
ncbi:GvpL/GvpF family gas vesicle protein [Alteribacillus sp. HJP-4]|uniref:GvpL/GvpF family gas vesicle protein n=1 Tax=Alteribacillus sp. HJP-4 TaxID=2775394 RepID=UPI0035CCFDC1